VVVRDRRCNRACVTAAAIALGLILALAPAAYGAPGDLDSGFGSGGIFTAPHQTPLPTLERQQLTAVDSMGRPIVAWTFDDGAANDHADLRLVVARLTPSGQLDPSFNPGGPRPGTVTVDFSDDAPGANVKARGVAVGPGGTIYALGSVDTGDFFGARIGLVRLTGSGTYDSTFGGDGRVVDAVQAQEGRTPEDLAVDQSGNAVVAGTRVTGCPPFPCEVFPFVDRFTPTGIPDPTWNEDGRAEPAAALQGQLHAAEALPGGAVVAAGQDQNGDALAVRLGAGGDPDSAFSGDGVASTTFGHGVGQSAIAFGVAADSSERVLLTGSMVGSTNRFAVARFTAAGQPDMTWGSGVPTTGTVLLPARAGTGVDVEAQPDGKVIATGSGSYDPPGPLDGQGAIELARLTGTGALDTTFAPSESIPGMRQIVAGTDSRAARLALDADGRILVAGVRRNFAQGDPGAGDVKPVVVRVLGDDAPDTDGDGVPDNVDNCPGAANPGQQDTDNDGQGNACDADDDNDGDADGQDNCPVNANPAQQDADGDGAGDACDPNDDNDPYPDGQDNCPMTPNPGQQDTDADGQGDACDATPSGTPPEPPAGSGGPGPTARFSWRPGPQPCAGTVVFDASGSTAGDAAVASYRWEIYIPTPFGFQPRYVLAAGTTTTPIFRHVFTYELDFDDETGEPRNELDPAYVYLVVTDAAGRAAETTEVVSFTNPVLQFEYGPSGALLPPKGTDPCPGGAAHLSVIAALPSLTGTLSAAVRAGALELTQRCPPGERLCGATLVGSVTPRRAGLSTHAAQRRRRARTVAITKKLEFAIPPGKTAKIRLKLNKRGKSLLRSGRLRRVRLTYTPLALQGKPKSKTRVVRVRGR
jgi:uncharacterized delta-60 repeat protein